MSLNGRGEARRGEGEEGRGEPFGKTVVYRKLKKKIQLKKARESSHSKPSIHPVFSSEHTNTVKVKFCYVKHVNSLSLNNIIMFPKVLRTASILQLVYF